MVGLACVVIALVATIVVPALTKTTWREITSATDTRDFKTNCEYYLMFQWNDKSPRILFLNYIGIGETGYPGVSSVVATDFSKGNFCRIDNTDKETAKCDGINFPARVFERCYPELP